MAKSIILSIEFPGFDTILLKASLNIYIVNLFQVCKYFGNGLSAGYRVRQ